jgi:hypothetical protein
MRLMRISGAFRAESGRQLICLSRHLPALVDDCVSRVRESARKQTCPDRELCLDVPDDQHIAEPSRSNEDALDDLPAVLSPYEDTATAESDCASYEVRVLNNANPREAEFHD